MKKLLLISSVLLLGFLLFKYSELLEEKQPTENSSTSSVDIQNIKSRRVTTESETLVFDTSASGEILDIINKDRSVLKRTPEILALRKMNLSAADESTLLKHLEKVDLQESQSIKNDIIEHMVRYGSDQKQVGHTLLQIMKNSAQDRVIREYVLQYVPEYYLNRWDPSRPWDEDSDQDRQLFNETLWEMTDLTEGSMAGGALFALFRLADKYQDLNQNEVFNKSLNVMTDPSYMNPNRMGAVQILAFSKNEKYFQAARELALDKNQPVLLKVTAINTAIQSSSIDEDFLKHLNFIAKGGEGVHPSLKKCAELTLLKLRNQREF